VSANRWDAWLLGGIFALFLALPALDTAFHLDSTPPPANQPRVPPPPRPAGLAGLEAWRDGFESYLDDSFGWRNWAVRAFDRLNYRLFRVSEQRTVVVGKDGWLYYGAGGAEYQRATKPFVGVERKRWGRSIEARERWLGERGIKYLFTVAPNKHTLYPEHLPAKYRRTGPYSRYEQLVDYFAKKNSPVTIVDLHTPLLAAKARQQVYERTGTHWNNRGAYVAYRTLFAQLAEWFPRLAPVPWEQMQFTDKGPGDLATMLGLKGIVEEELPRPSGGVRHVHSEFHRLGTVVTSQDDPTLPRAVIFHDSFVVSLAPYLAEHFSYAVFQWRPVFDGALVLEVMPDIVIEERVERRLLLSPIKNILPQPDGGG
jgi:alginate O-acetyltransferase complex protein AlgJ